MVGGAPRIGRLGVALFALTLALVVGWPHATLAATTPEALAVTIERRAERTSFADLEAWGDAAAKGHDRESLRRLAHVNAVLVSQSEFALADYYNDLLARNAARQGDRRFAMLARINELKSRRSQGDMSLGKEVEQLAKTDADWFVRVEATGVWARMLMENNQAGEALKQLGLAEQLIPEHDPDGPAAEVVIWEEIGLAMMDLNDLAGVARAFERSQVTYANSAYPRPDFDAVYNMTLVAVQLGDGPLARRLAEAHHRLSRRSDLHSLTVWDESLCAMVAEAFGTPAEVLRCMASLDANLTGAEFRAVRLLPARAIAEARLGQVEKARADLARFRVLRASGKFDPTNFDRDPEVAAEIMAAVAPSRAAFDALRAYDKAQRFRTAKAVYRGVRQVSDSLEAQVATARDDARLEHDAVRAQRLILGLAAGLILGALAVVAWQRSSAQRLRAAQAEAEAASRAKSAFLATMSHEIRTPLNGVLGMAQALEAGELSGVQRERVGVIRQSGETLLAILNDVLDLAKIEAGKLGLEEVEFNMSALAMGAHGAFTALAERKGVDFSLVVEPAARGRYRSDSTRIRQILYNLISNALKFTEGGEVRVVVSREGGEVRIAISDTGIGMSAETVTRLFGKFEQADASMTRRFGGTGLGLAICQELATLLGGTISATSVEGKGSTFRVTLPLERLGEERDEAEAAAAAADVEAGAEAGLRVLAAEDNAVNQLVLKTLLHQVGVEPVVVGDGAEALEAWRTGDWDVVLMDIQMPRLDGPSAARIIREEERATGRRRTPIVALTANAMAHHIAEYAACGMDGFVAKPIDAARLFAAIAEATGEPAEDGAEAAA